MPFKTKITPVIATLFAFGALCASCQGAESSNGDSSTAGTSGAGGSGASTSGGSDSGGVGGNGAVSSGGSSVDSGAGTGGGGTGGSADAGPAAPAFCDGLRTELGPGDWASTQVYYANDRLVYAEDAEHNRIADFSYAGYHYGEEEPPSVPEATRLEAQSGDQTARIQAAIDALAKQAPDANGFRGALVLGPGTFQIDGTLRIHTSGIVLRGSGDGESPTTNTVLTAPGNSPADRSVIVVGSGSGNDFDREVPGTRTEMAETAWTGSIDIKLADASKYSVGDRVLIRHPSTTAWIKSVEGDQASPQWEAGSLDIVSRRRVVAVSGNTITLDAPLFDHHNLALSAPYVFQIDASGQVDHVGVESLRVDIVTAGGDDENHAKNAITVFGAEDAWVRDVTALHFTYAAVQMRSTVRVTVDDVFALDPVSVVDGGRRYNFSADSEAQLVLVKNSHASNGRHHFVSNGTTSVNGLVFYNSISESAYTSSEGHRRWSQGMLFDNLSEVQGRNTRVFGFYNRGDWGTSHYWSNTQSVAWNINTGNGSAVFQKPPGGQNWAIGGTGDFSGNGPFSGPAGFLEQNGDGLLPHSLYIAQLCERFWTQHLIWPIVEPG